MGLNPEDEQLEDIITSIPKFHVDHAPENGLLMKLAEVYQQTVQYAETLYEEAHDAMTPGTTPLLHTLPYFRIPIEQAWYSSDIAQFIQDEPFEKQIDWLDREGKYVSIVFGGERETTLYAATFKKSFHASDASNLVLLEDYFIRENKIFLLPRLIKETTQNLTHLHAFDLKLNRRMLERVWPAPFEDDVKKYLPHHAYRNAVEAFHHLMQSDLTMADMRDAITKATGWEDFKIEDRFTYDLSAGKKRLYDDMDISLATFIVALPEYLAGDKVRINVALTLVDESKQSETHYWFFLDVERVDTLIPEEEKRVATKKNKLDTTYKEDHMTHFVYRRFLEDLFDGMQYDLSVRYDQSGVFGGFYDGTFSWDASKFTAVLEMIRHHFDLPVCPPDFKSIEQQLDLMTDRLNIRSYQQGNEEMRFYHQRRLKEVLLELGEAGLYAIFSGLRPFQFEETIKFLEFGRAEVIEEADQQEVRPFVRVVENLFFHHSTEPERLDLDARLDPEERPAPTTGFRLDEDRLEMEPEPVDENAIPEYRLDESVLDGVETGEVGFFLDTDVLDDPDFSGWVDGTLFDETLSYPRSRSTADEVEIIRRDFPEIPRSFLREPYYTKTRLVVRPNQDGTERFELLGSLDGIEWTVIESQPNDGLANKIAFSHDVNASGTRYYRVRAVAGFEYSLPTLALDASVMPIT